MKEICIMLPVAIESSRFSHLAPLRERAACHQGQLNDLLKILERGTRFLAGKEITLTQKERRNRVCAAIKLTSILTSEVEQLRCKVGGNVLNFKNTGVE